MANLTFKPARMSRASARCGGCKSVSASRASSASSSETASPSPSPSPSTSTSASASTAAATGSASSSAGVASGSALAVGDAVARASAAPTSVSVAASSRASCELSTVHPGHWRPPGPRRGAEQCASQKASRAMWQAKRRVRAIAMTSRKKTEIR